MFTCFSALVVNFVSAQPLVDQPPHYIPALQGLAYMLYLELRSTSLPSPFQHLLHVYIAAAPFTEAHTPIHYSLLFASLSCHLIEKRSIQKPDLQHLDTDAGTATRPLLRLVIGRSTRDGVRFPSRPFNYPALLRGIYIDTL